MSLDDLVKEFKEKLANEPELRVPMLFFYDKLTSHPSFLSIGVQTSNQVLETIIKKVCAVIFEKDVKIKNKTLIIIPKYSLIHGSFMVENNFGALAYCLDIRVGIINLTSGPQTGESKLVRFSITDTDPRNPKFYVH